MKHKKMGWPDPWGLRTIERAAMALPLLHTSNMFDMKAAAIIYSELYLDAPELHCDMMSRLCSLAEAHAVMLRDHGPHMMQILAAYNTSATFMMNSTVHLDKGKQKATIAMQAPNGEFTEEERSCLKAFIEPEVVDFAERLYLAGQKKPTEKFRQTEKLTSPKGLKQKDGPQNSRRGSRASSDAQ